jgi:F5/8 type C domain
VIDTSPVYGLPDFKDAIRQMATVSARPHGENEPVNAVDGAANTFWQVCANQPFPIELALRFPAPHTIRGYSLATVDKADRMPSNWEIWVSSDRTNWRRLQDVTDAKPWEKREERRYDVEPQPDITGVKLVINSTRAKSCMRLYEFRPIF